MDSLWPDGVRTREDMRRYAETLFGHCEIEDLLRGAEFENYPLCYLFRVKGACRQDHWQRWTNLIDEAMQATVEMFGRADIIQVKSKLSGARRARMYDTLQVTPHAAAEYPSAATNIIYCLRAPQRPQPRR